MESFAFAITWFLSAHSLVSGTIMPMVLCPESVENAPSSLILLHKMYLTYAAAYRN